MGSIDRLFFYLTLDQLLAFVIGLTVGPWLLALFSVFAWSLGDWVARGWQADE